LLLNDSSSPVNITTFEKVLVEVENTEKPPPWCTKEYPEKPTGLIAVSGTQAGSVMLNWTKSSFPVTHYAIVYGIESGNFSYGNPNVGDVDQYLVEGLKPGNLYYFAVIAVNDCANSDYSDETSAEAASENGLIPNTCQCDLSSVVEDECISPKTAYCSGKFTCICSVPPTNTCNLHSTQGACIAVIDDLGRPTCMWHESFGGTYPACKLAGDYDNNETVNLDDIMYILDHYNGTESEFTQPMDAILIVLDNYDF